MTNGKEKNISATIIYIFACLQTSGNIFKLNNQPREKKETSVNYLRHKTLHVMTLAQPT